MNADVMTGILTAIIGQGERPGPTQGLGPVTWEPLVTLQCEQIARRASHVYWIFCQLELNTSPGPCATEPKTAKLHVLSKAFKGIGDDF